MPCGRQSNVMRFAILDRPADPRLWFAMLLIVPALALVLVIPELQLVAAAAVIGAVGLGLMLLRLRAREVMLWIVVLIGVFNFAPALVTGENLNEQAVWTKVIKDACLLLLFGTAAFLPAARGMDGFHVALAAWAVVFVFGVYLSPGPLGEAALSFRYYVLYPAVLLAIRRVDPSEQELRRVLRGLIMLGALQGLIAVAELQGLGASFYEGSVEIQGERYRRAIGTLGQPNNLGLFLGLPALLLPARLFSRRATAVLAVLIGAGIALSFSRSAALALAISFLINREMPRRAKTVAVVLLVVPLVWTILFVRQPSLGSRPTGQAQTFSEWTASTRTLLLGEGYGLEREESAIATDNMALGLAREGGVLAVTLMVLVVVTGFRPNRKDRIGDSLKAYAIFFLLYTPIAGNLRLFPGALLFWMVLGLMSRGGTSENDQGHAPMSIRAAFGHQSGAAGSLRT